MTRFLLGSLLLTVGAASCFADIVYNQPATFPGGNASQKCTGCFGNIGIDFRSFDDFTLTSGTAIQGVQWQGAYDTPNGRQITGFTIAFWQDSAGLPGPMLQSYAISGNAGETFVATGINGFADYRYAAALPTPFSVSANTKYWLSIQPMLIFPPQWYWRAGEGGDGVSAFLDPNISSTPELVLEDTAFALSDSPLPEPATVGLVGAGMLILAFKGLALRERARNQ